MVLRRSFVFLSPCQTLETWLKVTLPDDLGEALSNGTVLCQLVNHIRPRSVAIIHIPSPAVVRDEEMMMKERQIYLIFI